MASQEKADRIDAQWWERILRVVGLPRVEQLETAVQGLEAVRWASLGHSVQRSPVYPLSRDSSPMCGSFSFVWVCLGNYPLTSSSVHHDHGLKPAIFTKRTIKYSWGRSPFSELQAPHSSCRFSRWSAPPRDCGMMWSMVKLRKGEQHFAPSAQSFLLPEKHMLVLSVGDRNFYICAPGYVGTSCDVAMVK